MFSCVLQTNSWFNCSAMLYSSLIIFLSKLILGTVLKSCSPLLSLDFKMIVQPYSYYTIVINLKFDNFFDSLRTFSKVYSFENIGYMLGLLIVVQLYKTLSSLHLKFAFPELPNFYLSSFYSVNIMTS